ncbi:MAG: polyribonucleotide nucleotidyltransferase [Pseudomonadota bacterium]
MNPIKKSFQFGRHTVTMETGAIARQATSAVLVSMDDTAVLVTVVADKTEDPSRDFFPLTVNYQEKYYAAGRIPGGFLKREGRPSDRETLIARLIDRPIRPLFPDGFTNEVQVIATVVSLNPEIETDIVALIGTSAALSIAGIPFNGPVGACRVGFLNNEYILNPTKSEMESSQLDLVVAGTEQAVLMVESEAQELTENQMLGAVMYGHEQMQQVVNAVNEFTTEVNKDQWDWQAPAKDVDSIERVKQTVGDDVVAAYKIADKLERKTKLSELKEKSVAALVENPEENQENVDKIKDAFSALEKNVVRTAVVNGEKRIDGRDHDMIRAIYVNTGVLPKTHGSAVFTRGETQALVTATLGTARDAQILDGIGQEQKDTFILHYNFPPYCVGETGFIGSPKRREIGHGRLAKRGIQAIMPSQKEFPYVVRVVSEITESNGSSSMASVCGSSLALMDAGVPIKAPVAGIAMGLVKEDEKYVVLSDILGDEDHLGDMDFKVAGTSSGITALQMDIKIEGITKEIMEVALRQAKAGRLHILDVMNQAIATPKDDISDLAPRITSLKIDPQKISDVIGKGGSTIRSITEDTGATIEIQDDGTVNIAATDNTAAQAAIKRIEALSKDVMDGEIYDGKVTRIADFGAFVEILPGKEGLVHISQIANERVSKVSDHLKTGQAVKVKVLEIDKQGRIRLSIKALLEPTQEVTEKSE